MGYDKLLDTAEQHGLYVYEVDFKSRSKGLIRGKIVGIEKHLSKPEKTCILAEELGHYHTTVGNILDQTDIGNRKQELRAREWAYHCMLPLDRIVQAHHERISGRYDLAEYLGVTEQFLQAAIDRYTEKYGLYVKADDRHYICFEPLRVLELLPGIDLTLLLK